MRSRRYFLSAGALAVAGAGGVDGAGLEQPATARAARALKRSR
jgi:hypothetical protein